MLRKLTRRTVRNGRDAIRMWRGVPIVRKTGFWFVDIPRTSSSSIKAELGARFGPAYGKSNLIEREHATAQLFRDHLTAATMRDRLGHESWDALYTFTFVRNPYDRIVSLYNYRLKRASIPSDWSFSEFTSRMVEADHRTPRFKALTMRSTMSDYLLDPDGALLVKDVLRFENRAAGIAQVGRTIGYPELGRLHIQQASPAERSYRPMYDDQTRDRVTSFCQRDLELFGYAF